MGDIEDIARRYIEAVRDKDDGAFLALYDEDAVVFDLWDRWSYVGREAWGASVAAWFGSLGDEQVQVDFEPVSSVVAGDWAVWCAFTRYSALDRSGTVLRSMQNRLSWSLRRTDNQWLIVHEHTSAPADHQSLTVSLTRDGLSGRTS